MTGTWVVVRGHLRTGWLGLLMWAGAMAALVTAIASGVASLYPTQEARDLYAATMGASPAGIAFNGRWHDLMTLGGIATYEIGFMGLLLLPPIALHLTISRTRTEEDSGRAELLTAGRIGRLAPVAGGLVVVTLTAAVFALLSFGGLVLVGLPRAGAGWYAGSLGLFVWWFGALGLVVAQVGRTARTAMGLGLAVALGMFLVRAVLDGRGIQAAWATPMGWLPEVRPFSGTPSPWPLAGFAVTGAVLVGAAGLIAARRDLGSGVLAPTPGPPRGSRLLGHPLGVAWRLTRGGALGWMLGLLVWGVAIGTLTGEMADLVRTNPGLAQLLGTGRPEDIVTALAAVVIALGGGAFGLQALGVLQAEEATGRLALLSAAPMARARVWASWWIAIGAQVSAVVVAGSVGLGVTTGVVTDQTGALGDAMVAAGAYLPAILALVSLAAFAGTVVPAGLAVGWVLLAWTAVVALLADTLRLPEWSRRLSVLDQVGRVPIDPVDTLAVAVAGGAASLVLLAATGVGWVRDLRAG
ncbi:ABC transporter permease [Granulicoccus sp. GXG6511]|uniref:ABC transporter permease n=1 Tax=Granulicoccus sp. GXG6511 TaxID=3381351 RepID=UPI003D7C563E